MGNKTNKIQILKIKQANKSYFKCINKRRESFLKSECK